MAAANEGRIIRAPGRLIVNPTEAFATSEFSHGGVEIGDSRLVLFVPAGSSFIVWNEALKAPTDELEAGNLWEMRFFLRGWDDDAIQWLMSGNYTTGEESRHAVVEIPGPRLPGQSALDRSVVIAFVPFDPENVPGVVVYNGVPHWGEAQEIAFQRGEELGIPMLVNCFHNSSGTIARLGRVADLALE